jgi:hypothetical protein
MKKKTVCFGNVATHACLLCAFCLIKHEKKVAQKSANTKMEENVEK